MNPSDLKVNSSYSVDCTRLYYQLPPEKILATFVGRVGDSMPFYTFRQEGDVVFPYFNLTVIEVINAVSYINIDESMS